MKKLVLLLFSIISSFSPLSLFPQDGWINQANVINAGLYDIHSASNPAGEITSYWMVGDSGTVLESRGFPNGWALQESGTESNLRGVYFFPDGRGFSVGQGGTLIRSRNYGNNWEPAELNITADLSDIWFINDTAGIIIGDSGTFLVSVNDGMDWETGCLVTNRNLNKIRQFSSSVIWIVGDSGTVFKTADAGLNWQAVNTGFYNDFNDIYLADPDCIYIAGDSGLVIKTEDGGLNWFDMSVPSSADIHGVACMNCYNLWVCGDNGAMFCRTAVDTAWREYSGDTGGLDFHSLMYIPEGFYFFFAADSGSYIYLPNFNGNGPLYKAGENMSYQVADFTSPREGFLGGDGILHTSDGGYHWYSLHPGGLSDFPQVVAMDFIDDSIGWVIGIRNYFGYHSWIFKTEDGGNSWTEQYYNEDLGLTCIFFADEFHGWAGGDEGLLLRTDDGGENWIEIQPANPDLNYVQEIYFYNQMEGYMTRGYGEFLTTDDGGYNWQLREEFTGAFEDFFVYDDTIIWVLMNFSGLNKSIDGGLSWINFPFPYDNHNVNSLIFLNDQEGYACGTWNSLWHTTDGGENWELDTVGNKPDDYSRVIFADSANGWLLGQYGSILHGPGQYVGVAEKQDHGGNTFSIFPNPAQNRVNFAFHDRQPDKPAFLTIFNIIGKEMITKEIQDNQPDFILEISSFLPGVYFAVFREGDIISSVKFIVIGER